MNEIFNRQHQDLRTEKGLEYGDHAPFTNFEYLPKNTAANRAKAPAAPKR